MKTPIKYKVYRQSVEMGGKLYGVINNADPVNSELTMQQIIEAKKLYGYTAKGLSVLVEEVLQGAADLVARDGQPRNLSSLLKFEARIKGAFSSTSSGITDQDIFVRPRMLKDIKATLDKASFTFVNETSGDAPRIVGLALDSVDFIGWNADTIWNVNRFIGNLTVSGDRLLLDGQTPSDVKMSLAVIRGDTIYRLDHAEKIFDSGNESSGFLASVPSVASLNTLVFESKDITTMPDNTLTFAWRASSVDPLANKVDVALGPASSFAPAPGDKLILTIARPLSAGVGYATVSKEVVLA